MYLKNFKIISIAFLVLMFMVPQNIFAQQLSVVKSEAERIIKQYEQGNLTNPTSQEKQIVSEYMESIKKPQNISKQKLLSPDATIFFEEDFTQTLMYDNFDFTGLLSDNGWVAHSGAGNNQISTTTGLTYTDYFGSGVGNAALIGAYSSSAEDVNRGFTEQNTNGDVIYYSCLVNVTDDSLDKAGTYFMMLGDRVSPTSFTSFSARVFTKIESDAVYFGLSNTSTPTYGTTAFAKNTTYLLIVKYTINNGGADETKLWVVSSGIPADEVAAGTPEVINTTTNGQDVIDAFALRQSGATQAETVVDGIRVGKTWSDIFPSTVPPAGWTNVDNGITGDLWEFNNPGGRTITGNFDEDFAMLDSDHYGSSTQDATLTTLAVDCSGATNVSFGFDSQFRWYSLGVSTGTVEVSNDGSTWTNLETIAGASEGYPNPPVYKEYDVTSVAAGQSTVYFRWTYVGDFDYWWAIDNVIVYEPDAFPNPAVVVNPLDAEVDVFPSTTLDWMAGGGAAPTGYRLYFGTDGGGVSLPTNIENNTDLGNVTQYTPASALTFGTTYYWSLVPYNLAGDATGNPIWSFTVLTPYTQPYSQDFNDGTAEGWLTTGFSILDNHGTSSSYAASKNFWSAATTGWVQTPIVGPLTATSQLEFDYRIVNYSLYPGTATVLDADTFKIQISTDFGTTFTTVFVIDSSNHVTSTDFANIVVPLGSYSGQSVIARWDGKWAAGDYYFDIDNVKLRETPLVPIISLTPNSKDFGTVNLGSSSTNQTFTITNIGAGTLTINSGGISIVGTDASQFVLTDGNTYPINLLATQSATVDVNFTPTTVGAKSADLQVVDNTADGTTTAPLTGTGFDATITTFPYAEAFENAGSIPTGWEQGAGNTENWLFGLSASYAATADHTTGSGYIAWIDDSTPDNANPSNLVSPPLDVSGLTTPTASFWYWIGISTNPGGASTIHVDVYNGSSWTDDVIMPLVQNDQWALIELDLTPYKSSATKVRFRGNEQLSGAFNCDLSIDDFSIFDNTAIPNCAANVSPLDASTDVAIGTDLIWAGSGGGPTGYYLYFGTDNPPTNLVNGVDQGNLTTYDPPTDLSYSTTYYWQVIAYNGNGQATGCSIWSFTTLDDPTITTFPYAQDFEGVAFPPLGWENYGTKLWTQTLTGGLAGSQGARVSYTPDGTANLQTPPVVLPASPEHRITFWWKDNDISTGPILKNENGLRDGPDVAGYDTTYFEISSDGGTSWTELAFLSEATPNTDYIEVIRDLGAYAGETVLFRWRDVVDPAAGFSAYGTGLDDVTILESPACT